MPHRTCILLLLGVFLFADNLLHADLIKLKNGGELRGKVEIGENGIGNEAVTIRTLSGAVVVVLRSEMEFLTIRSMATEEYETRLRTLANNPEAHWELAEWCKENSLVEEREHHLNQVIALDPEHVKAHYALGHRKRDGQWMSRDQEMEAQGYIKYKGRYITQQELEIIEKSQAELDAEREWFKQLKIWEGWLQGRHPQRQSEALGGLQAIKDPHAVSGLERIFKDNENRQIRMLYVQVLTQIPGGKPVGPLVWQSLWDPDQEIRYNSLMGISSDQFAAAVPFYVRALKNDLNTIVDRAGTALQRVGNDSAIPYLIEALITTHRYKVVVPDNSNSLSFSADGNFGGSQQVVLPPEIELMMRSGQLPNGVIINNQSGPVYQKKKTVVFNKDHQNAAVLTALQKLTAQNFGFDERTWRLWYLAQKNGAAKVNAP